MILPGYSPQVLLKDDLIVEIIEEVDDGVNMGAGNIPTVFYAKPIWRKSYTLFLEVNVLVE